MQYTKSIFLLLLALVTLTRCSKDDTAPITKTQEQLILEMLSQYAEDTAIVSTAERAFLNEIRAIANDVEGLYAGVEAEPDYQAKYERLKANIRARIAIVTQKADDFYHHSPEQITLTRNAFVLMSYDALQRYAPAFYWTKLGIFAANEVRSGVVICYILKRGFDYHQVKWVLDPATGATAADVLMEATQILIGGQLDVFTDIGALALLNKYGPQNLKDQPWLTADAQRGFAIQYDAEQALKNGNIAAYQDLQTTAAIEFGAHEQLYILQKLWDKPLMGLFAQVNQWTLGLSQGQFAIFGDLFIGVNKFTHPEEGFTVKIPANGHNLVSGADRVEIARNGFNSLNRQRKNANWSFKIDYAQARIGHAYGIYRW